jgi:hypothetical protein
MLGQLSEQVRLCQERASDAKERADATNDSVMKAEYLAQEKHWLTLARSYGFTESLEDFTTGILPYSDTSDFETVAGSTFKGVELAHVALCFYSE